MRNFKKLIAVVSAFALLLTVFSGINMFASADYVADPAKELADFKAAMATKATLTAGTYVEAGDTEYYHGMLRTREGPSGTWDPAFEDYTAVAEMPVGHWSMAYPAGSLFGLVVNKTVAYKNNDIWLGASTVYNVVPGTYVAAVVNANTDATWADGTFASKFRYETSADGETWTALTATIKDAHHWTGNFCQAAYAIAIVQIPEGAKYYRITMAGFDEARITNALKNDGLWCETGYDTSAGVSGFSPVIKGYGIASVIASACDLTAVTNYTEITDYTYVSAETRAFQKAMAQKETLTAGTIAHIADADKWLGMVRSKAGPSNGTNADPMTGFNNWHKIVNASVFNANNNLGDLFGIRNEDSVSHFSASNGWMGTTVVYNVVPGTYVATVLNMDPDYTWDTRIEGGFRFEVSANGQTWNVVNPTINNITGWATTQQLSHGTAVLQIPEGMKYYRITMRDFNDTISTNLWDENLWAAATFSDNGYVTGFAGYGIGMSIVSNDNLNNVTHYSEISDVKVPSAFDKKMTDIVTLEAGTTIEADTANGYMGMVRTVEGPSGVQLTDPYAAFNNYTTVSEFTSLDWGYSHPAGNLFGKANYKVRTYNSPEDYLGAANIYKVVPGTYVAAVVTANQDLYYEGIFANGYRYDVSANGETWTTVTPVIKNVSTWKAGYSQVANALAIVQIPENVNYYRITLAGFDTARITDTFTTAGLWCQTGYDHNGVGGFNNGYRFAGIGAVMASATDLTDVAEFDENGAAKYDVVVPAGVATSTNAVKKDDVVTVNIDQTEKFLVAGSLKVNGKSIFAKGDSDVPGEGSGTSFKFTVAKDGKAEVTAEFKDFADVVAEDNFATIAASRNEEASAIRFLTRQYLEDGMIRIGENLYNVLYSGTIFLPTDMIDGELTHESENIVDVQVKYLYDKTAKYIDHACGIKGLSEALQSREITARAYVAYDVGGETVYAYADTVAASFAGLAQ